MSPRILPSAFEDLQNGRDFYDGLREGLGTYFLESLFAEIESLRIFGGIHGKKYGFHRLLVTKFPYAVYYKIEKDQVMVYRILDCRSDPAKHKQSLQ
jgi:hypothetical protein